MRLRSPPDEARGLDEGDVARAIASLAARGLLPPGSGRPAVNAGAAGPIATRSGRVKGSARTRHTSSLREWPASQRITRGATATPKTNEQTSPHVFRETPREEFFASVFALKLITVSLTYNIDAQQESSCARFHKSQLKTSTKINKFDTELMIAFQ